MANFIVNHYLIFLIIAILLVFALIGYFVEAKRAKENPYKIEKQEEEINLDSLQVTEDMSLQSMLNRNSGVNDPNKDNPNIV